jgi:hypothetical protein
MKLRDIVSIGTSAAALLAVLSLAPVTADGQAQANAQTRGAIFPRQLTVYDRRGKLLRTLGEPGDYYQPVVSPDGTRLAVGRADPGTPANIWVFDLSTGASTQVTSNPSPEAAPVWSPDGSQIAYVSIRENYTGLYRKASNGTGSEELLYRHTLGAGMFITDWSPDGRFLLLHSGGVLYLLPLTGERTPVELVREEFKVLGARFSPDSRFLAYGSDESDRNEVYVRPFDPSLGFSPGAGRWQVSNQGDLDMVHWRQDGREIYYLGADGGMMAVEVTTTPAFQAGPAKLLFQAPTTDPPYGNPGALGSISRDGQRFVFAVPLPPERKQVTVPPEILTKYTGTYEAPAALDTSVPFEGNVVVTLEGDQLMVQPAGAEKRPLFSESETYFFFKTTNGDIEFVKDDKGAVTHLILYQGNLRTKATRQ